MALFFKKMHTYFGLWYQKRLSNNEDVRTEGEVESLLNVKLGYEVNKMEETAI